VDHRPSREQRAVSHDDWRTTKEEINIVLAVPLRLSFIKAAALRIARQTRALTACGAPLPT
jgi:hypothetical protein